jgi:hypothetical protein
MSGEITIEDMRPVLELSELRDKCEYMLMILNLEEPVELFAKRLINYFNKFKKPL